MRILLLMIPISIVLLGIAIWAFVWAVRRGQFDDLDTPALDILVENDAPRPRPRKETEPLSLRERGRGEGVSETAEPEVPMVLPDGSSTAPAVRARPHPPLRGTLSQRERGTAEPPDAA